MRRSDWRAIIPHNNFELLRLLVKYVIIGHGREKYCNKRESCVDVLRNKQFYTLTKYLEDIGPNYLISNDGFVYEGRGANVVGKLEKSYDHKSISIMFFGFDENESILKVTFLHLDHLLKQLEKLKVLDPKYTILGHCQIYNSTPSPGQRIMNNLIMYSLFYHTQEPNMRDMNPMSCY